MMLSVYLDFLALSNQDKAAFLKAIKAKSTNKTRKPKRK
jgi:hypothetical protein